MNLVKEDEELLLVQCNLCKKEFTIKKEKCSKAKEGYELNEPIKCDNCGQEDNSIIDYKKMMKIYNVRDKKRNLQTFEREKRIEAAKQETKIDNQIKCPNCKSSNVKKISGLSKAGSVALFGIFSISKVSKTYECKSCSYRW